MKSATQHWTLQRLSAIALIPLSYWLITFLHLCLQANYFDITQWLDVPLNKIALLFWLLVTCYHAALGIQVVLEDYVSNQKKQRLAILSVNALFASFALSAVVILF